MKKKTEYKLHAIFGPLGILMLALAVIFLVMAICVSIVHLFSSMK